MESTDTEVPVNRLSNVGLARLHIRLMECERALILGDIYEHASAYRAKHRIKACTCVGFGKPDESCQRCDGWGVMSS